MKGTKKYNINLIDISKIKNLLFEEFNQIKIISQKTNSLIVLIENMQAPYEILITNTEGEINLEEEFMNYIENIVDITLIGSVEFRYRESDNNDKYFK